jgi:YggT family protein
VALFPARPLFGRGRTGNLPPVPARPPGRRTGRGLVRHDRIPLVSLPRPAPRARVFMRAILDIILIVLDLYVWLLIASAILSWLIAFNVVNTRNQFVATITDFLYRITEPVLRPIRSAMPDLGGLDISPIILILIIMLIQRVITYYIYPNVF